MAEDLKEYVCWLSPTNEVNLSRYNKARSQTIWAKNPADAEAKLAYLETEDSVKVKCLYSMEEFNCRMTAVKEQEAKTKKQIMAKAVETENV